MTLRKYLVLAAIALFGALGDVCLDRGMNDIGRVSLDNLGVLVGALFNPWVTLGIVLLLGFFAAYAIALSWADLTFVLPATSIGYVLIALFAQLFLHQEVTLMRWIGILLVSGGVGIVAGGPALTIKPKPHAPPSAPRAQGSEAG